MQIYDIIMLVILAIATYRGYRKGLAWQVASIASIVVSYFVAYRFRDQVAVHLDMADPWRQLLAMLILFVASSLVIWFLFQTIKGIIEKAKLKEFDQQLGAIFGAIQGGALCVVITLFAVSLLQPDMTRQIVDSHSGGYIARVLDKTETLMPPEIHEILEPYLEKPKEILHDGPEASESEFPMEVPMEDWIRGANRSDVDPWRDVSGDDTNWR